MKPFILVLVYIFILSSDIFGSDATVLGERLSYINNYLSLNNEGDKVLVSFCDNDQYGGLWIMEKNKDESHKIADFPACLGTWSFSNNNIAYVVDSKLVIADNDGNIIKEIQTGMKFIDSID